MENLAIHAFSAIRFGIPNHMDQEIFHRTGAGMLFLMRDAADLRSGLPSLRFRRKADF